MEIDSKYEPEQNGVCVIEKKFTSTVCNFQMLSLNEFSILLLVRLDVIPPSLNLQRASLSRL